MFNNQLCRRGNTLVCSICLFVQCKYFHCGLFEVTYMLSLSMELGRDTHNLLWYQPALAHCVKSNLSPDMKYKISFRSLFFLHHFRPSLSHFLSLPLSPPSLSTVESSMEVTLTLLMLHKCPFSVHCMEAVYVYHRAMYRCYFLNTQVCTCGSDHWEP